MEKLRVILPNESLRKLLVVLIVVFFSSSLEVVGVASILPFIALLANSQLIEENT